MRTVVEVKRGGRDFAGTLMVTYLRPSLVIRAFCLAILLSGHLTPLSRAGEPSVAAAAGTTSLEGFTLLFSSNMGGKVEPCG